MSKEQLKSCPFCGGEAALFYNGVKCLRCGVRKLNEEIWNTRAEAKQVEVTSGDIDILIAENIEENQLTQPKLKEAIIQLLKSKGMK